MRRAVTGKDRQAEARHILKRLEQEAEKTGRQLARGPSVQANGRSAGAAGLGLVIGYLLAAPLLLAHLLATYVM